MSKKNYKIQLTLLNRSLLHLMDGQQVLQIFLFTMLQHIGSTQILNKKVPSLGLYHSMNHILHQTSVIAYKVP